MVFHELARQKACRVIEGHLLGDHVHMKSRTPFLDHFGEDLVLRAREGKLDPVPERGWEFGEIAQVIARRQLNSAVLTGENSADIFRTVRGLA